MRLVRHSDAKSFRQQTERFLLSNEVMNNVILGVTTRLMNQSEIFDYDVFLAHIENDAGEIIATTMRTVPRGVMLSNVLDTAAIPILVDAYTEVYDTLPSVEGQARDSLQFAELWQRKSGQDFSIKMELGQYRLDTVIPPKNVYGQARRANKQDFELLTDWLIKFSSDTGLDANYKHKIAMQNIQNKLEKPILGGIHVWIDDGEIVSMVAVTRESPNGANISMVYTPSQFRGKGYASAITAHVSQAVLDVGKKFCYLSTDMANPTSNKIYQAIGYKFVGNTRRIEFQNHQEGL